jgi:hypothetical protein
VKSTYIMAATILVTASLTGCSSTPKLSGYEGPQAMERVEVVQAQKDCIFAKLRPTVEYVVKKTDSGKVLVPVNVHCELYGTGR